MTVGISAGYVNGWLDTLSGTAFTAPAAAAIRLHIGDPGAAGTANGANGDTTRKAITLAAASGGSKALSGTSPVWTNGGTSETLSHISEWSATTGGTFGFSAALTAPAAWATGNTFTLTSLSVTIAPVAA